VTRAIVAFSVLCVVFGTTFGAIAVGIDRGWPPLLAAGARFTIAGAIVLAIAALRGDLHRPSRALALQIAFIGLTVTTTTFAALYTAERVIPSGLAALVSATGPAFAVIIALVARRRRADAMLVAGLAIGTLGVALVVGIGSITLGAAGALAALSIVASECAFAAGLTMTREIAGRAPVLMIAGAQQLFGGIALLVLSSAFEHALPRALGDPVGWFALAYLAIVASAGAHTLAIWLAGVTSATFATSWTYVSPFIALVVGGAFLHELIPLAAWIGGACVIVGAALLNADLRTSIAGARIARARHAG
jgi:drug/metabolite transporter (DMT)-like permease